MHEYDNMNIQFFCPRWGSEVLPWDAFMAKVKAAGYDGIEWGIHNDMPARDIEHVWQLAEKYELKIIAQHYATYAADFTEHRAGYKGWFDKIKPFNPYKIDTQTGKDYFSFSQNQELIRIAADFEASTGIKVLHETHRNKFAFAAHITKEYLQQIPYLQITLDISHWVCVAESYLEDQAEAVQLAIERTEHIHARVGYPEGPQVPDPRVPEWQEAVDHHVAWWDQVVARKRAANQELTITPEFGPAPYLVSLPFTRQPITNQWEVNEYMMNLLKKRYSR
jgi:sugar phosphate isomerase/epimerase